MDPQLVLLLARISNGTDQVLDLVRDFCLRQRTPAAEVEMMQRVLAIMESQQRLSIDLRAALAAPKG